MTLTTIAWAALILGAFGSFVIMLAYGQWATGPGMRTAPRRREPASHARRVPAKAAVRPSERPNVFHDAAA